MKGEEIELIAQLLLESRTADNNNINKDSQLAMLPAKRKPANHKASHIPWSRKIIPTSRIRLASTLCTQGLFTPVAGDA